MNGLRARPRLALALGLAVLAVVTVSVTLSQVNQPDTEAGPASLDKVVVFAVPGLSIDDLDRGLMPNLDRLADQGSIAVANVRIRSAQPDVAGAYATLGAGNATTGTETDVAAFSRTDRIGDVTVADAMAAQSGVAPRGDIVVPFMVGAAEEMRPEGGSAPGALADAMAARGRRTAVVTNASPVVDPGATGQPAPAALAVASADGSIDAGSVSSDLLTERPGPDGTPQVQADPGTFVGAVDRALERADVIVADPGDTTRAMEAIAAAPEVPAGANDPRPVEPPDDRLRTEALVRTDRILGQVRSRIGRDTLLMVVGVTPPGSRWALTPVVAAGRGIPPGYLDSGSTHRPALVTLTDLTPTILDTLGVDVPPAMIGTPLRYRAADASWDQARRLDDLLASQASVSRAMTLTFIVVQSVIYGVAFLFLVGPGVPRRLHRLFELGALTCGAWPVVTFLLRVGTSLYSLGPGTFALSWLIAVALALAAQQLRSHPLDPTLAVTGLTVAVLVGDLSSGSHLQLGSFFGYPPQTAPRFIGLGNSAFAILAGATMVFIASLVARTSDRGGDSERAWWVAVTVAVLVIFAVGAPWTGADVGGTLAIVPVLTLTLWALRGRRIRWQVLLVAVGLGVLVLAAGVGLDALRAPDQRTHLGRFFLDSGDSTTVFETLRRKWDLNIATMRQSPGTLVVPVVVAFAVATLGRLRAVQRVIPRGSATRISVVASLAVGILGWLLNDSGLIVLALASVYLGPLLVLLVLRSPAVAGSATRPTHPLPGPVPVAPNGAGIGALATDPVIVAIVPAKDRADSIGDTVTALTALPALDRVLVVDDGSVDETTSAARVAGAQVLRLAQNRGKGGAVLAGAAQSPDADVYLLIDADVARTASAASDLLAPVLAGRAEMTIGVLPPAEGRAGFGTIKRLAGRGVHRACGFEPVAPLSGQRAIRADLLRDLPSAERFGLEVAMTVDVVRAGGRVAEVEVPMDHRHTGRSLAGFVHRGRQGLDIVRSLWPRLVPRRLRLALLATGVAVWGIGSYVSASAAVPEGRPPAVGAEKVVLFGIGDLGLRDVTPARMPNLYRLSETGAYGMATPRTAGGRVPDAGYATIGAGDRARDTPATTGPGAALDRLTTVFPDPAAAGAPAFVVPRMEQLVRSASDRVSSRPGALGQALHQAGRRTAVVASSATALDDGPPSAGSTAPAALAVADRGGLIDRGTVGTDLLRADPSSPFGIRADPGAVDRAVRSALLGADVVVVDPGDTDRASGFRSFLPSGEGELRRIEALTRTDETLGRVAASLPARTRLIVVGIDPPPGARLVPLVVAGPDLGGHRLTSPSTRRPDLVALTDLAPTVLDSLGVATPRSMIGHAIEYQRGRPDRAELLRQDGLIVIRDQGYGTVLNTFIWVIAALYLIAAVVLLAPRLGHRSRQAVRWMALTTTAWPLATFVVRGLGPLYDLGLGTHLLVWAMAAIGATAASRWRTHPLDPLLAISAVTLVVLSIDLATGGHLQTSSYLGYTPSVAARFVGIGNSAFGVYGAAAVITGAAWVARASRPGDAWWGAAAVAAIAVLVDGAPWLGSDVGGILTLVPSFGLMLLLLAGRRPTWRSMLALATATLTLLGAVVGVEALRPPDQRTHIGQFFLSGDQSGFWTTIARKWDVNIRLLTTSNWTWLIVVILAFLLIGRGWLSLTRPGSPERAGLIGLVAVAALGWFTNDSGPLVAALVLVFLGACVIVLATRESDSAEGTGALTATEPVLYPPVARDVRIPVS